MACLLIMDHLSADRTHYIMMMCSMQPALLQQASASAQARGGHEGQRSFHNQGETAHHRAFSLLKAPTFYISIQTLLRDYEIFANLRVYSSNYHEVEKT